MRGRPYGGWNKKFLKKANDTYLTTSQVSSSGLYMSITMFLTLCFLAASGLAGCMTSKALAVARSARAAIEKYIFGLEYGSKVGNLEFNVP